MNTTPNESDNAPVEVFSVADFTKWVDELSGGEVLFRGLVNAEWDVESSLHRRLKYNKLKDAADDIYHDIFVEMVKILISRSRRNGHDIEHGRELKDLELLVNLQHYGAATCLIDFTKNSLIALYFACASADNENDNKTSGKVVAFNSDNVDSYDEISIKNFDKEIEHWFKEYEQNKKLWILSPKKLGNRIVSQQSVFVFGSPTLPTRNFHICKIKNKKAIIKELKKYGISAETLFDDFVGFSAQNSYNKEYENWDTDSHFMSGILYYISGNYKSAIKCYDKEIKSNPQSKTYYNRGFAKDHLGNFQDALSDYDEAIRLNPEYLSAYNNRGASKMNLGKPQDAINDYDKAIKLNPKWWLTYYNRGTAKQVLGNFQDAINDFDEAVRLDPKAYITYNNRGMAKQALGNFQDAINDFDDTIKLNPKSLEAYNNRGNAKGNLGKHQDAISDFDKAIRLNPKDPTSYYNRGIFKQKLGNFQDSINDFDEAIRLNPQYSAAYNNRGVAKGSLGKHQDAISDLDEVIRLNPQYSVAHYNRGVAKVELDDKKGAAIDFAKAKELNPELEIPDLPPDNPNK